MSLLKHLNRFFYPTLMFVFFLVHSAHAISVSFEEDSRIPMVELALWLKGGAAQDPPGKEGLTNFMGWSLIRGTTHYKKAELEKRLDKLGAAIYIDTRPDGMIIRSSVLSDKLPEFLDLLKEVVTAPAFNATELTKLKEEIKGIILEKRGKDNELARYWFDRLFFAGHPYSYSVRGTLKSLASFTVADLNKQYRKIFQPDYISVVGAGMADTNLVKAWANRLGTSLKSTGPLDEILSPEKLHHDYQVVLIDKPALTQTQILIGLPGMHPKNPDYDAIELGNEVFGGGVFTSRAYREIRLQHGWSYGARSFFRHGKYARNWNLFYFPANKDVAESLVYAMGMLEKVKKEGVTKEEFREAQNGMVQAAGFNYNTPGKRVENKILEQMWDLPTDYFKTTGDRLSKLNLEEVNRKFQTFIQPDKVMILILCTAKDLKQKIADGLKMDASKIKVIAYDSKAYD